VLEHEAAAAGRTTDRSRWWLMGPMHLAETRQKAARQEAGAAQV